LIAEKMKLEREPQNKAQNKQTHNSIDLRVATFHFHFNFAVHLREHLNELIVAKFFPAQHRTLQRKPNHYFPFSQTKILFLCCYFQQFFRNHCFVLHRRKRNSILQTKTKRKGGKQQQQSKTFSF
jgi:hypothetical protein